MDDQAALIARRVALAAAARLNAPADVEAYHRLAIEVGECSVYCAHATDLATGGADDEDEFGVSAPKDGRPKAPDRSVATYLYGTTELAGVTFASEHGDDTAQWAITERAECPAISLPLAAVERYLLHPEYPDLQAALRVLAFRCAATL